MDQNAWDPFSRHQHRLQTIHERRRSTQPRICSGPASSAQNDRGPGNLYQTGYRLFHNHISIELCLEFFEFGSPGLDELSETTRMSAFKTVAESDLSGLVFTLVWACDLDSDRQFVERVAREWKARTNGGLYVLELHSLLERDLERNRHPVRLAAKPNKRNIERSEANLRDFRTLYRMHSGGQLPIDVPHILIENKSLEPAETARRFLDLAAINEGRPS